MTQSDCCTTQTIGNHWNFGIADYINFSFYTYIYIYNIIHIYRYIYIYIYNIFDLNLRAFSRNLPKTQSSVKLIMVLNVLRLSQIFYFLLFKIQTFARN